MKETTYHFKYKCDFATCKFNLPIYERGCTKFFTVDGILYCPIRLDKILKMNKPINPK